MENKSTGKGPSLEEVLRQINQSVDDFLSQPAKTASDRGAFEDYPLHKVAAWGDVEAASVLIANGADVNAIGEDADTALHRAVAHGHDSMVSFLLSKGANSRLLNRYGNSPADDASESGNVNLMQVFAATR